MAEDSTVQFTITQQERQSALWKKLLGQWQRELYTERIHNDATRSEIATANTRGRISKLKELIALNSAEQEDDDDPNGPFAA